MCETAAVSLLRCFWILILSYLVPIPLRIGNMYTPARTTISHIVTFVTVGIDW